MRTPEAREAAGKKSLIVSLAKLQRIDEAFSTTSASSNEGVLAEQSSH